MILLIVPYSYLWRFHSDNKPTITWRKKVHFFSAKYLSSTSKSKSIISFAVPTLCLYLAQVLLGIQIVSAAEVFLIEISKCSSQSSRSSHSSWSSWSSMNNWTTAQQEVVISGNGINDGQVDQLNKKWSSWAGWGDSQLGRTLLLRWPSPGCSTSLSSLSLH